MIGIPWQLAFALRADGWYLRSDIIWQKPNCLPEAVKDRPTKSYEHIFLLSKSPHYYYDTAAISEPVAPVTVERNKRAVSDRTKYAKGVGGAKPQALFLPRSHSDMPTKRNKRDVWSVSTNSHRGYGHFAMYPERLIEPCILAGSPEQGLVLDPFFGSGTTGAVCKRLSRRYLGIELNPEYCETAKTRIQQTKEELYLGSKINREIRNYTEAMFFGLSLRQFIFLSLPAALRWACISCSSPISARKRYRGCAF